VTTDSCVANVTGTTTVSAWHVGAKVVAEGAAAGMALLAAAATGDVALVALATPLAIAAVLGLTRRRPQPPRVEVTVVPLVSRPQEPIDVKLTLRASTAETCQIRLVLPPGVESDDAAHWTVLLRAGQAEELSCMIRANRPGRFTVGRVLVRWSDGSGTVVGRGTGGTPATIEARPLPSTLKLLVRPERVRATSGDRVARLAADGIEFADVREEHAGALERRINWRATARRGTTCVNTHHPERSTDVVLLVDTFSEAMLPPVVAIAVSLAETYLKRHDRIGLVSFGGVLDWVEPGSGPSHLERIRRSLLSSEAYFSYAWKTADVIPRRLFPLGCLVLAVSPLGDERFTSTLASLRSRGVDLAIIEVEPKSLPADLDSTSAGRLAQRIVAMERDELRRRFWWFGVPVVTIDGQDGIAAGLAEIAAFRRSVRVRASARR
jgi:uncharacterized protein (DUF58 family)